MDNWPGWKMERKTEADFAKEQRHIAEDLTVTVGMYPGIAVGIVGGVAVYFFILWLLPLCSATFTLVK